MSSPYLGKSRRWRGPYPRLHKNDELREIIALAERIHHRMSGTVADLVWIGPHIKTIRKPPDTERVEALMQLAEKLRA